MTIDDLKRALVEVKQICYRNSPQCEGCPFNLAEDDDAFCRINDFPEDWWVDGWKEDTHATD